MDGILEKSEGDDLETLRKQFGMSKGRADALVKKLKNKRLKGGFKLSPLSK